ncbi:MAG TPA: SgcJ/EcaC family oxidoreductase [Actinoallomurus sp.]|nr:SgcJ/EcaC family oxidoreductase [Actinoallomurus sp.]
MTTDTDAVRDVLQRIYAAWADNDADAFAALYTEDATVVMPRVFKRGRTAVRDHMAGGFAGPLKGSRGVDDPQDIRVIGTDTAIVVSRGGIVMAGEREVPAEREVLATWVLAKRDGRWLIAAYANAPLR